MPVKRLSTSGGYLNKSTYSSMLAGYGDFGAIQRIASKTFTDDLTSQFGFSNIPGNYQDLILVGQSRSTGAYNFASHSIYLNGTGATGWSETILLGSGTATSSTRVLSSTPCYGFQFRYDEGIIGANYATGIFSSFVVNILSYANSSNYKTVIGKLSSDAGTAGRNSLVTGLWQNTAAISSMTIEIQGTIKAGSTYSLYGVRAGAS